MPTVHSADPRHQTTRFSTDIWRAGQLLEEVVLLGPEPSAAFEPMREMDFTHDHLAKHDTRYFGYKRQAISFPLMAFFIVQAGGLTVRAFPSYYRSRCWRGRRRASLDLFPSRNTGRSENSRCSDCEDVVFESGLRSPQAERIDVDRIGASAGPLHGVPPCSIHRLCHEE